MAELETEVVETTTEDSAEIERLKAELLKAQNKNDSLAKEIAEQKKAIRAKQTEEEAASAEAKELAEAQAKELAELRKQIEVSNSAKKVLGGVITDEKTATAIAENLYGAADSAGVIEAFNNAWTAREKSLRLEYGKIPAPGVGSTEGPTMTKEQLDNLSYNDRAKFAAEHSDEYERLMGR